MPYSSPFRVSFPCVHSVSLPLVCVAFARASYSANMETREAPPALLILMIENANLIALMRSLSKPCFY
jgi:hypothetical protein